ncbi:MAG: hypothetical protein EVG15_03030 [Candidatus Acididesulfobacter diazotrophicus]|uniref:Uncharacterized protein n=1 Tax=Candidatus Acididesulfobacter diazotrophicus TaxID=2597226 RepID=A0A519BP92_9DELT|nr:MAG: hypothetical protein EVG15_03030 [Candidatus Acididesulfobacter diazotrophicus]
MTIRLSVFFLIEITCGAGGGGITGAIGYPVFAHPDKIKAEKKINSINKKNKIKSFFLTILINNIHEIYLNYLFS